MSHDPLTRALTPPREADNRYAAWKRAGESIMLRYSKVQWDLADWIVRGMDSFEECYQDLEDITGLAYSTITNKASICRKWPRWHRIYELSWSHYAASAYWPADWRAHLMSHAVRQKLSVARMEARWARVKRGLARRNGDMPTDARPQSFTGTGTAYLQDTNRIIIELNAEELKWPDWSFNGENVRVTIERRKP